MLASLTKAHSEENWNAVLLVSPSDVRVGELLCHWLIQALDLARQSTKPRYATGCRLVISPCSWPEY